MQLPVLLLACALALLTLAYVLYPLYRHRLAKPALASSLAGKDMRTPVVDSEQAARLSLQEVELDYQLGNIGESDYHSLRERYMRRAILAMKARHENVGDGQEESELEQGTQDGQVSEIDRKIEEELRKMRASREGVGGNDEDA